MSKDLVTKEGVADLIRPDADRPECFVLTLPCLSETFRVNADGDVFVDYHFPTPEVEGLALSGEASPEERLAEYATGYASQNSNIYALRFAG